MENPQAFLDVINIFFLAFGVIIVCLFLYAVSLFFEAYQASRGKKVDTQERRNEACIELADDWILCQTQIFRLPQSKIEALFIRMTEYEVQRMERVGVFIRARPSTRCSGWSG